jgi:hypothetical protein
MKAEAAIGAIEEGHSPTADGTRKHSKFFHFHKQKNFSSQFSLGHLYHVFHHLFDTASKTETGNLAKNFFQFLSIIKHISVQD